MPQISIDKAKPGMLIIEKVINDKGMVLLPEGTVLSEALIDRLVNWNVQTLVYKSDGADGGDAEDQHGARGWNDELQKQLDDKFSSVKHDPIMLEIYNAVKRYFEGDNS